MADARSTLKVAPRAEFGSRSSRRLRGDGLVPGVVYSGGSEATAFQVSEREVRDVISRGRGAVRPRDRRWQSRPGRRQGAAAAPGSRQPPAHRPAGGEARRGDRGRGRDRAGGRRDRPRRQRRRRARARHPRDHGRSAADRHPGRIVVDVSAMEINDTLQLSSIAGPQRRHLRRRRPRGGHDRHPLAAAGRGGARARGRGGDRAGRRGRRGRGRVRRRRGRLGRAPRASSPCRCSAAVTE